MRKRLLLVVLVCVIFSACSTTRIMPVASATGTVDSQAQSITEVRDGIAYTVRMDLLGVSSHPMIDTVAAIHVTIENRTTTPFVSSTKSFLLRDGTGQQYPSITPERVTEIVSKDTVYLIPYPYVGYYYLRDQMRLSQQDVYSSELPYYAEYHPQEIYTRALPEGPVLPQSKVAGLVYFIANVEQTNRFDVLVFPDSGFVGSPLATFSFTVEK